VVNHIFIFLLVSRLRFEVLKREKEGGFKSYKNKKETRKFFHKNNPNSAPEGPINKKMSSVH